MDVRDFAAADAAGFPLVPRGWLTISSVSADPARHAAGDA
jgi:hypothetical protein